MDRTLAIVLAATLALAAPTAVMAHGGGGGHVGGGGGGHGGGHGGGPGGSGHFGGGSGPTFMNQEGHTFVVGNGGHGRALASHGAPGAVAGNGRWAVIGGHRFHGRHFRGFFADLGFVDYWYYGDCFIWTDNGWVNLCGADYY